MAARLRAGLGYALETARQTFDLTPLHETIREWRGRLDTAPAVAAFLAGGMDTSDGVPWRTSSGPAGDPGLARPAVPERLRRARPAPAGGAGDGARRARYRLPPAVGWPQWDPTDPEGPDLRRADVGPLTVVYFINQPREYLYVLDIVWAG